MPCIGLRYVRDSAFRTCRECALWRPPRGVFSPQVGQWVCGVSRRRGLSCGGPAPPTVSRSGITARRGSTDPGSGVVAGAGPAAGGVPAVVRIEGEVDPTAYRRAAAL